MTELPANAYSLGRRVARIEAPYRREDSSFAGQRLNCAVINEATYRHCTFVNISFKEAILRDCIFSDCIFIGCYFRRTRLFNCTFEGSRFYDCDFPRLALAGCRFYYVQFRGCQIAFDEMEHSFPSEPNVREELCRNLARQSSALGLADDARRYRQAAASARERHLKNAFTSYSEWYRGHFVGMQKVRALQMWLWSKANRALWGYCESGTRLAINFGAATLLLFPVIYYLLDSWLSTNAYAHAPTALDYLLLSLSASTPAELGHTVSLADWPLKVATVAQSLYSVVLVAMFAAFLFQWSSRR